MKKLLGIFGLLLAVCLFATWASESFRSGYNVENLMAVINKYCPTE
mgnify:CR=1 FL=1